MISWPAATAERSVRVASHTPDVYCGLCLVEHVGEGRYCVECAGAVANADADTFLNAQLLSRLAPLADDRVLLRLDELIEVAVLAAELGPLDRRELRDPIMRVARASGALDTRAALMELSARALAAAASLPAGEERARVQGGV